MLETKRAIKPLLTCQPSDGGKRYKHASHRQAEQFRYVPLFVMANFVRDHGFQFWLGELRDECIEQDDFSKTSKPGKERVGVARTFAAVHHIDAARGKLGAPRQGEKALAQRSSRQ